MKLFLLILVGASLFAHSEVMATEILKQERLIEGSKKKAYYFTIDKTVKPKMLHSKSPTIPITSETYLFVPPSTNMIVLQPQSYDSKVLGKQLKNHYGISMVVYGIFYAMVTLLASQ